MVSVSRLKMNNALKKIVIPYLREHHFKGSFPHFRRKNNTHMDLITFQFNRYGGSFVVELATCPLIGLTTSWGEDIPFNKVTAHDVSSRYRLIQDLENESNASNQWFNYEDMTSEQQFEQVAYTVKHLLHIDDPNWVYQLLQGKM